MAQRERGASSRTAARPPRTGRPGRGADVREERPPAVDLRALREKLRRLVEPAVVDAGLDLDDLVLSRAGRRIVVRVTVDGDAGVGHDELSEVSRDISAVLDEAESRDGELTPGSYMLEVSSPGVERPLTLPRHWKRNVGRLVTVRIGERSVTARVTAVDDDGVRLDGVGDAPVAFGHLGPGHVQVEFTRLAELAEEDFGEDWAEDDEPDQDDGDGENDTAAHRADTGQEEGA